jgi:hypothetical protein
MLKPGDSAVEHLNERLKFVASSVYSADSPPLREIIGDGLRFEELQPSAKVEVVQSSVDWEYYKDSGLSNAQSAVILRNVRNGEPTERWLDGIFDGAVLENQKIASFKAMVSDSINSSYFFEEIDKDSEHRHWAELSAAGKLQYIVRDAALCDVAFEPFSQSVKEAIGDVGDAALRVVFESQKELYAIAELLPEDRRIEGTPLVERVQEVMDYVSGLETQEQERRQGRKELFEGIGDVLDGKPPARWLEGARAFHDILYGEKPKQQESKTQERGGREM